MPDIIWKIWKFLLIGMVLFLVELVRVFMVDRYTIFTVHSPKNLSSIYEGWNFNSGNYLFTTDTK